MKNSKLLFDDFIKRIKLQESADEISSIAFFVFELVFGVTRTEILSEKMIETSLHFEMRLDEIAERLNHEEPIQYILGKAFFYGRSFRVDSSVLIPRPETEELVKLGIKYLAGRPTPRILDIGTGSGCIPITLSLEISNSTVFATDISNEALLLAARNAHLLNTTINFMEHDILSSEIPFGDFDLITSNPPYIAQSEISKMKKNVVAFEPHLALFVSEHDPLIFYREIATKASKALKPGGALLVEINERFGAEVKTIFEMYGFTDADIKRDFQGKDRIVIGLRAR